MKRPYLLVLTVLIAYNAFGQQIITRDSLVGIWICQEALLPKGAVVPAQEQEAIKKMQEAMVSCRFELKADGFFSWDLKDVVLNKEMEFLRNQPWQINPTDGAIIVGKPKENLMQIKAYEEDGVTYFIMQDFPCLLRVIKQK